ncbi:glycosyltransferase family 4 protein [Cellulosimicrobium cellulans]|uniref:glycosyltransferase family 4 protein n=1 Tax=Cellulosimicrobium cellulans TaxID=1710 RepID=UPI00130ED367|nr:glycosyltransferase family 1 protein [Cellulosimicrobium cellulans]
MSVVPARERGSETDDPEVLLRALDQRVHAAAVALLGHERASAATDIEPGSVSAQLLPPLVEHAAAAGDADRWLLLTAVRAAFPTARDLVDLRRALATTPTREIATSLLRDVLGAPGLGRADLPMDLVDGGVVVDVDFSARNDTHTGIHRVVRETVPRWQGRDVTPVAWVDQYSVFRRLAPREADRVLRFGQDVPPSDASGYAPRLVVPWRSTVVLPDVPNGDASDHLATLARFSGNRLSLIGYDMIPITSAETRPQHDAVVFGQYLTVVKHAHRVAGISRSATTEFAGFADALAAQDLPGPVVREVRLVEDAPPVGTARPAGPRPRVLCVASREPHKNQRAVLHAAERLWREGLDFELELIGGPGWSDALLAPAIARAREAGRPLIDSGRVADDYLWSALRGASFTVFVSLHEGYGLPVADSLACGTPVVTSDFGSQLEIAEAGGCLTVDPRDDDAITDAMRRLLTEPATLAELRAQALARPRRTWDEYADELWQVLVDGGTGL